MKKVLFTAAHSGFALNTVPLGGGAAVCEHLVREWEVARPFPFAVLGPAILGDRAPQEKALVRYSELEYAQFCLDFERALTDLILKQDPATTVVLSNDVSEGPDFKALAEKGYPIYTIYHVDVVDYFTTIYLKSLVTPQWTTAAYRWLRRWGVARLLPKVAKLVWEKQEASVRHSKGLVVPSARMKDVLLKCYPGAPPEKIHVLPWGSWEESASPDAVQREKDALRVQYPVPEGAWVLLTLSRISPEKGQDRLLEALKRWESRPDYPKEGICLFIAGEAAYMMGEKFRRKLGKLAARLMRTRVYFCGYASGARKKALFELADLYVFPSWHESYGLTLLEALRAGKPVLTSPSHGAKEVFRPEFGEMTEDFVEGLRHLLLDRKALQEKGAKAAAWAKNQDFSVTASKLAALLASQ